MKFEIINLVNCYNNELEVIAYAKMLSLQSDCNKVLLAVNINSLSTFSGDGLLIKLKETFEHSYIVQSDHNLGYLNGMLNVYRSLEERGVYNLNSCKYIIMSNTDIILCSSSFIRDLIRSKYEDAIGCIGPSIFSKERRTYDNPQRLERYTLSGINKRIFVFSHPFLAFFYFNLSSLKSKLRNNKKSRSCYTYSCHGCFFILKHDFFRAIKDVDYECLMYSEEAYIAEKLISNGYRAYYDEHLEVEHLESTVTRLLGIKKKCELFRVSLEYIRNSFFIYEFKRSF